MKETPMYKFSRLGVTYMPGSLTEAFHSKCDKFTELTAKQVDKKKANLRNKTNQRAIGNWHKETRGKTVEIPFPTRGK